MLIKSGTVKAHYTQENSKEIFNSKNKYCGKMAVLYKKIAKAKCKLEIKNIKYLMKKKTHFF